MSDINKNFIKRKPTFSREKKYLKDLGIINAVKSCKDYNKFSKIDSPMQTFEVPKYNIDRLKYSTNLSGYCTHCSANNLLIIDLDIEKLSNPINEIGIINFKKLCNDHNLSYDDILSNNYVVNTSNKGKHIYFKLAAAMNNELISKVGGLENTINSLEVSPGIDILMGIRNLVLPYSFTKQDKLINGGIGQYIPANNNPIKELPEEVFNLILSLLINKKAGKVDGEIINLTNIDENMIIKDKLDIHSALQATINEGKRNTTLTAIAGKILYEYPYMDIDTFTMVLQGINSLHCCPPLKVSEVDKMALGFHNKWAVSTKSPWYDKDNVLRPKKLAEIVKANGNLIYHKGNFYRYENGYFKLLEDEKFPSIVNDLLMPKDIKINKYNEIKAQFKNSLYVKEVRFEKDVINAKNGLVKVTPEGVELMKHTKDYIGIIQTKAEFDPTLTLNDAPYFKDTITKMANGDKDMLNLLQEIGGSALVPTTFLKKIFVLQGETNTMKSGLLNGLTAVLDSTMFSRVSPQEMQKTDGFALKNIYGKTLNFCGEVSTASILDSTILKSVTGEDMLQANVKNKDHITFVNTATHIFNFNGAIKFNNDGEAMTKRLVIIPCVYRLKEKDIIENYYENFGNERNAILSWFIQGLQRLIKNSWKFTEPQSSKTAIEDFDRESNPLKYYFNDLIVPDPDGILYVYQLYDHYRNYIEFEQGEKTVQNYSFRKFKKSLSKIYVIQRKKANKQELSNTIINPSKLTNIDIIRGFKLKE